MEKGIVVHCVQLPSGLPWSKLLVKYETLIEHFCIVKTCNQQFLLLFLDHCCFSFGSRPESGLMPPSLTASFSIRFSYAQNQRLKKSIDANNTSEKGHPYPWVLF